MVRQIASPSLPRTSQGSHSFSSFPSGPSTKLARTPLKGMDEPQVPLPSSVSNVKSKGKAKAGTEFAVKVVARAKARPRSSVHTSTAGQTPALRRKSGTRRIELEDVDPDADTDPEDLGPTGLRTPPDSQTDTFLAFAPQQSFSRTLPRAGSSRLPTPPATQSISSIPSQSPQTTPARPNQRRRSAPLGSPANPSPNPRARKTARMSSVLVRKAPATAPRPARPAPAVHAIRRVSASQPIRKRRQSTPARGDLSKSTSTRAVDNFGSHKGATGTLVRVRKNPVKPASPGDDPLRIRGREDRPRSVTPRPDPSYNLLDVTLPPSSANSARTLLSVAKSRSPSMLRDQAPPSILASSPSWSLPVPSPRPGPIARTSRSVSFAPHENAESPTRPTYPSFEDAETPYMDFGDDMGMGGGFGSDSDDGGADDTFAYLHGGNDFSALLTERERDDATPVPRSPVTAPSQQSHYQDLVMSEGRILIESEPAASTSMPVAKEADNVQAEEQQEEIWEDVEVDAAPIDFAQQDEGENEASPGIDSGPHDHSVDLTNVPSDELPPAGQPDLDEGSTTPVVHIAPLSAVNCLTSPVASFLRSPTRSPRFRGRSLSTFSTNHQYSPDVHVRLGGSPVFVPSTHVENWTPEAEQREDVTEVASLPEVVQIADEPGQCQREEEEERTEARHEQHEAAGVLQQQKQNQQHEEHFELALHSEPSKDPLKEESRDLTPSSESTDEAQNPISQDQCEQREQQSHSPVHAQRERSQSLSWPLEDSEESHQEELEGDVTVEADPADWAADEQDLAESREQKAQDVTSQDQSKQHEQQSHSPIHAQREGSQSLSWPLEDSEESHQEELEGDVTVEADPADWAVDEQEHAEPPEQEEGEERREEATDAERRELSSVAEQLHQRSERIVVRVVERIVKVETPEPEASPERLGGEVAPRVTPVEESIPQSPVQSASVVVESTTPQNSPPVRTETLSQASVERPVFRFTGGGGGVSALETMLLRRSAAGSGTSSSRRSPSARLPSIAPPIPRLSQPRSLLEELQRSAESPEVDEITSDESEESEEDEEPLHGSVVEVSSMDPRAAARAAAILKLNHDYIEHGVIPPEGLYKPSERSRVNHSKSITLDESASSNKTIAGDMTHSELLQEAELDIVAHRRASRSVSVATSTIAPTEASDGDDLRLPGSFVFTPGRKRKAKTPRAARRSSVAPPIENRSWGVPEWKRLERCYREERKVWVEERTVRKAAKPSHGGLLAWARRSQAAPVAKEWEDDRVVDRFIKDSKMAESDLTGEWERTVLALRVKALSRRLSLSGSDTKRQVSPPAKRARTVSPLPAAPFTPARAQAGQTTVQTPAPPSTIKRVLGYVLGGLGSSTTRQRPTPRSPPTKPQQSLLATLRQAQPVTSATQSQPSEASISHLPEMRQSTVQGTNVASLSASITTSSIYPSLNPPLSQRSSAIQALFAPDTAPPARSTPRPIPIISQRQSSGLANSSLSRSTQSVKDLVRSFESQEDLTASIGLRRVDSRGSVNSSRR